MFAERPDPGSLSVGEGGAGDELQLLPGVAFDGGEHQVYLWTTPLKKETGLPTIGVLSLSSNRIRKPRVKSDSPFETTDLTEGERQILRDVLVEGGLLGLGPVS